MINYGASPRASINLALAAKAYAFIKEEVMLFLKIYVRYVYRNETPYWLDL